MKLQINRAGQGIQWVRAGISTFFRQPLALTGLFFIFLAVMSIVGMVPLVGSVLALVLLPGATLGFMAATREAQSGKFPMPTILWSAFGAGRTQLRAMLLLGAIYAAGFLLVMGVCTLIDGGKFASIYLLGGAMTPEVVQEGDFQAAMLVASLLYLPLSLMFWHAPALVHWHGIAPIKSLFFSLVACMRNFWAFTVYGIAWMVVFFGFAITMATLASIFGSTEVVAAAIYPATLLLAASFFTSTYFTFVDCFSTTTEETP